MSIRYNLDNLTKQINATFIDKNFLQNLYHSMTGITGIIKAIHETGGKEWAAHAVYDDGTLLFPEKAQQEQFTQSFQPYIPSILEFMQHGPIHGQIHGQIHGGEMEEQEQKQSEPIGPDDIYSKAVHMIDNINAAAHQFASDYGILYYQREFEKNGDIHLVPDAITTPIKGLGPTGLAVGKVLSEIKLPIRTIVFLVYLILDVTRVSMSIAGSESNSRILSIVVALLELLKGDWKQAIVSFIGYYGKTPLLIGQNIKIFLYLYETLSPHLRENIIYGLPSVPKSILIGILLAIFKVTAPYEVREPVKKALERIREKNNEINKVLTDADLQPRADYFSPTFDDLNNLQSIISGDTEYICSCEYEEIIKPLRDSSMLYIAIQMLNIPISKDFRRVRCGSSQCTPFIPALVKKSMTPIKPLENVIENNKEPGQLNAVELKNTVEQEAVKQEAVEQEAVEQEPVEELKEEPKEEELKEESKEESKEELKEEPKEEEPNEELKEEPKEEPTDELKKEPKEKEPGSIGGRRRRQSKNTRRLRYSNK